MRPKNMAYISLATQKKYFCSCKDQATEGGRKLWVPSGILFYSFFEVLHQPWPRGHTATFCPLTDWMNASWQYGIKVPDQYPLSQSLYANVFLSHSPSVFPNTFSCSLVDQKWLPILSHFVHGTSFLLSPLINGKSVISLIKSIWKKWLCDSFQNQILRHWQLLLLVSWNVLSGRPKLLCNMSHHCDCCAS